MIALPEWRYCGHLIGPCQCLEPLFLPHSSPIRAFARSREPGALCPLRFLIPYKPYTMQSMQLVTAVPFFAAVKPKPAPRPSARAQVTTRPATVQDAVILQPIIRTAYASDKNWTNQSAFIKDERISVEELLAVIKKGVDPVIVAEVNGKVVGCVQVEFCRNHPDLNLPDDSALFGLLSVHHAYESLGIGWKLGQAAFDVARDQGKCRTGTIFVVNKRGDVQKWYERRGFKWTGETRDFTFSGKVLQKDVWFRVYVKDLLLEDAQAQQKQQQYVLQSRL